MTEKSLFQEFPTPSFQQWREVVEKSLKGASIEEKLVTKTYEEILLQPMYRKEDVENYPHLSSLPGDFPYMRGTNEEGYREVPWDVCQELNYSTPEEFNHAARNDLEKGQTMLHMVINEDKWYEPNSNQRKIHPLGVSLSNLQDFQIAFQDINLEEIPIYIESGSTGYPFFATLMAYLKTQKVDTKKIRGCIGMDPLGKLTLKGTLPYSINQAYELMSDLTKWSKLHAPKLQTIMIGARPYHEAGGNAFQELAFAVATGVEYLRNLVNQHNSIDEVAQRMSFSFSIGSNFFMEMAKFRAARMLWARIVKELGGNETSQKMHIHARTSAWTKTINDPFVNILRGTVEAFAGIMGGVNSLCVSPFDEAIRPADEFSRRIARNTQLILEKEAHLGKVVDPAGGSWYIETLTFSLAEKAWELFQKVEELGGMYSALQEGFPQKIVARTADEKTENIKRRTQKFVGVNIYPKLSEPSIGSRVSNEQNKFQNQTSALDQVDSYDDHQNSLVNSLFVKEAIQDFISNHAIENAIIAAKTGASIEDLVAAIKLPVFITPSIQTLHIHRAAEPFEELRRNSDAYKKRTGGLPKVFVTNIGVLPNDKHRIDFITDFFEIGGFTVIQHEGLPTITEAVTAYRFSQANIVVICTREDHYSEAVSSLARNIRRYKEEVPIVLSGNPSQVDKGLYIQAGVNDFIHPEVNIYQMLLELQELGGVRKCIK
ncbi:acyl-CoA mutase large subunit family protein [Neobacillus sp. MER 74]|uniref:methylmalonyl-CoA mutase family protein n=1 Tax=Neobacillus sp. MER 74 TaxID=2939566 RepID=UPI00203BBC8C|nr:methylmalonyl-CoA mutase family protein [Neobacillus sp. MER 74]MCM3113718.1 acyl-CoA mutase large subunit family protein [Neobacillus sp. MER 74]